MNTTSLPPISQMYQSANENHDYSVIRKYHHLKPIDTSKKRATKRGHYLEDVVKYHYSPGPANKSNVQPLWASKSALQIKYSDRKTYIDQIQKTSKKYNLPSSSQYKISMQWPQKQDRVKHPCQKISFVDTCLYQGDKNPGPGNYQISTTIGCKISDGKLNINKPLQPRKNILADMVTYTPMSIQYNTFDRIALKSKDKNASSSSKFNKTLQKDNKSSKKNVVPGPGHYQVISTWKGKQNLKKGQKYYWDKLSFGPTSSVYHECQNA